MNEPDTASHAGLFRKDRALLFLEREGNRRLRSLGTVLYRSTGGRIAPRNREVLLLTTRGRRSGREHTVLLQAFRNGGDVILAAANSGRSSHSDWFPRGARRDHGPGLAG